MIAYEIRDAAGVLRAIHERHDGPDGKRFVWRQPDGTAGLNGTKSTDLPLYGSERLNGAASVVVTEGEKAADALWSVGQPAVGTVCGASSTPSSDALAVLDGRLVYLWPDNDDAGRRHMVGIAARLLDRAALAVVDWPDAPPKGDAADYLADHDADERAALLAAAEAIVPPASPIVGIDAYRAAVPDSVPIVLEPLAYSGGVSLIAGPPKAGKSTLAAQLQRCRETGEPLFGSWPVKTGPTLLVTEEGGIAVVHKTNGLHALEILDRKAAAGHSFEEVLGLVGDWATTHPGGIVFIDTLAIWAGLEDENDSGSTTAALGLVALLAQETGTAVVVVHHTRKAGGENGEAIRGSSAILATVNIAAELSRDRDHSDSDDRWLDVQGRVIEPTRYRLAFGRAAGAYNLIDADAFRLFEILHDLQGIPTDGDGLTRDDLANLWGVDPRQRILRLLNAGRLHRKKVRSGRSSAWRHWAIPEASI